MTYESDELLRVEEPVLQTGELRMSFIARAGALRVASRLERWRAKQ
jgi:hypothetical protein